MKIAIIDDGINQNYFAQRIYQKLIFPVEYLKMEKTADMEQFARKLSDKFVEKLIL